MPKILNFKAVIEQDDKGYFIADVPAIPGCRSQGKSYEEAIKNTKEAIKLCLEVAEKEDLKSIKAIQKEIRSARKFLSSSLRQG